VIHDQVKGEYPEAAKGIAGVKDLSTSPSVYPSPLKEGDICFEGVKPLQTVLIIGWMQVGQGANICIKETGGK